MPIYRYTIFDSDPATSGDVAWPQATNVAVEAADDVAVEAAVQAILESACAGCNRTDGYRVGQTIHALVWDASGAIVAGPTHELTLVRGADVTIDADASIYGPMVRYWSVYEQRWAEQLACDVPDRELAAMDQSDRQRVIDAAARCEED